MTLEGSGEFVELLKDKGYDVQGFDLSESMIKQSKYSQLLSKQSMIDFNYEQQFDVITCFCDSLNYLLTIEEVARFFKLVHQHLTVGGLFIFDMLKEDILQFYNDEYYQEGILPTTTYQWSIQSQGDLLLHRFVFDDGQEQHIQKVYPLNDILKLLQDVGFKLDVIDKQIIGDYTEEKHIICVYK